MARIERGLLRWDRAFGTCDRGSPGARSDQSARRRFATAGRELDDAVGRKERRIENAARGEIRPRPKWSANRGRRAAGAKPERRTRGPLRSSWPVKGGGRAREAFRSTDAPGLDQVIEVRSREGRARGPRRLARAPTRQERCPRRPRMGRRSREARRACARDRRRREGARARPRGRDRRGRASPEDARGEHLPRAAQHRSRGGQSARTPPICDCRSTPHRSAPRRARAHSPHPLPHRTRAPQRRSSRASRGPAARDAGGRPPERASPCDEANAPSASHASTRPAWNIVSATRRRRVSSAWTAVFGASLMRARSTSDSTASGSAAIEWADASAAFAVSPRERAHRARASHAGAYDASIRRARLRATSTLGSTFPCSLLQRTSPIRVHISGSSVS